MRDEAAVPDGRALAECYEALRRDVLDSDGRRHSVRGLALLMCKGMAAWMKCAADGPARSASPAIPPGVTRLPHGIEQDVIDIVAAMALATSPEVTV